MLLLWIINLLEEQERHVGSTHALMLLWFSHSSFCSSVSEPGAFTKHRFCFSFFHFAFVFIWFQFSARVWTVTKWKCMLMYKHDSAFAANSRGGWSEVHFILCHSNACHLGVAWLSNYVPPVSFGIMHIHAAVLRCGENKVCMCVSCVMCVCVCVCAMLFTLDRAGIRRHILPSVVQNLCSQPVHLDSAVVACSILSSQQFT